MTKTIRLFRLFVIGIVALALMLPGASPQSQAHAGSAGLSAHKSASTRVARLAHTGDAPTMAALPATGVAASVPITVQVPAGNVAFLLAHATGVQIYTCTSTGWNSSVPSAILFNAAGAQIATHYLGPTWQANDGSTVVGHKLAAVTVAADSIPWLLLSAASTTLGPTGGNTLSATSYIQRLQTRGGLTPPASGCTAGVVGTQVSVPYTAVYVFWQAITFTTSVPGGAVGQSLTVTGTNFLAGESVQVSWDYTGTTPVATSTASSGGIVTATFAIPAGLTGQHTLLARGQTSGTTDFAYVQVGPRLTVTPMVGVAGSQVVASGDGYGSVEMVTLTWDSPAGTVVGTATSDTQGSFGAATAVTFTVPAGATSGFHHVYGIGQSSGAQAITGFKVH